MIKTVKKLSKKSLAILIALLMIISVMPFTPPISVEAATVGENTQLISDIKGQGFGGFKGTATSAADGSYSSSTLVNNGTKQDRMSNVLYTAGVGSGRPYQNWNKNWITMGVQYGSIAFLDDGTEMATPINCFSQNTFGSGTRKASYIALTNDSANLGLSLSTHWYGGTSRDTQKYDTGSNYYISNTTSTDGNANSGAAAYPTYYYSSTLILTNHSYDSSSPYSKQIDNISYSLKNNAGTTNTITFGKDSTKDNGNPIIYVVNYQPVKNLLTTISNSDEWKYAQKDNYYTVESLNTYLTAVKALVTLNPNTYFQNLGTTNDLSTPVSNCVTAMTTAISNYNTAKDALTHEHSFTGTYVNNGDGTHKQKCIHYDICGGISESVAHSYNSSVTTQPTCVKAGVTTYTCACGDYYTKDEPAATGHTAGNAVEENRQEATCTDTGSYNLVVRCTVCNEILSSTPQTIPAKGHTEVIDEAVAPTCTTTGLTEGKHCSVCNAVLVAQQTVDALGHTEGEPVVENRVEATCTTDGYYDEVVYCTVCKAELSRVQKTITMLGHSFTNYVSDNNATCTQDGTETATCDNGCGEKDTRTETGSATGHTYTSVVTAPTCTEQGYTTYTCSVCSDTYKDNFTDPIGHSYTKYTVTKAATCSETGIEVADCDNGCGEKDTQVIEVDPNAHKWGAWVDDKNGTTHTRECEYNAEHTDTQSHNMTGNTCDDCGYVSKVTITFVDKDGVSTSAEYAIGEAVTIPALPAIEYDDNGDGTHTVVTYAWDNTPQITAQTEATYTVVSSSDIVDCTYELSASDIKDGDVTKDEFTCSKCGGVMYKVVTDKTALNAAIVALQNDLDLPEAGYKYDAERVAAAKALITEANAIDRYADQSVVNAKAEAIATAKTELNAEENLAKYNLNFKILNYSENNTVIAEYTDGFENLAYGTTVDFDKYVIPTIDDDTSLSGLPQYAVYKWVKIVDGKEQKLNTTDIKISDVVKSDATYICYLMNFKASDEENNETRVRYIDKSGNTIEFDTATVGTKYEIKESVKAPLIPYYDFAGWNLVFGNADEVGTREVVFQATYSFNESVSNRCEIVGLNGVMVNGVERCTAIYDQKIELTGADKYAYADEYGNIIAPINENYIFAPHLNGVDKTIYITKVEAPVENATSIITGTFTTKDDPTYNYLVVNAQFYLPEGATAVESGIVIGNSNNADTLKIGSATKVVSTSQGDNHEYSIQMSYSKGKTGTLYARSYLIYVDGNGDTQTVYSDIAECALD